jgi:hypothetical protein
MQNCVLRRFATSLQAPTPVNHEMNYEIHCLRGDVSRLAHASASLFAVAALFGRLFEASFLTMLIFVPWDDT